MPRGAISRLLVLLGGAIAAVAFAGCSAEVSTGGSVPADEVAKEAKSALDKVAHEKGAPSFPPIQCPDDLDEDVGSKETCYWNQNGERHEVHVKVTGNHDDRVEMDFESDALPE